MSESEIIKTHAAMNAGRQQVFKIGVKRNDATLGLKAEFAEMIGPP